MFCRMARHARATGIWSGVLSGVAAGACWGGIFLAPEAVPDFTPLQLTASRYVAYGLCSLLLFALGSRGARRRLPWAGWQRLLVLGGLGIGYYALVAFAVDHVGSATTALTTGFTPVVVSLAGSRRPGGVPLRRLRLSIGAMALGLALCAPAGAWSVGGWTEGGAPRAGLAAALCALLSWSLFAVLNARWLRRYGDVGIATWGNMMGIATGALALLVLPLTHLFHTAHPHSRWIAFVSASFLLAIVGSVGSGFFWNRCTQRLPLTLAGQMVVGETLFALLYGCLWSGRGLSARQALAVVLMVGSVAMSARAHRPTGATTPDGSPVARS